MPAAAHCTSHSQGSRFASPQDAEDQDGTSAPRVHLDQGDGKAIADIHQLLTAKGPSEDTRPVYPEPHSSFDKFLESEIHAGKKKSNLGVSFKSLTTWGGGETQVNVKTLATAVWRTLTLQDIYEWTIKPWLADNEPQNGRPLIRDLSGVVRSGEMMLVLGRPGAGCSTFLRTIAGQHSSYLGVTGSIDYSGLSPEEVSKHFRGQVAYVPEDDVHFPTINVRQTLEFALQCKTPKRYRHRIPRYLDIYGRVFGMSHTMDTLVGNEYVRGVSGGERKRISIIESLATDSCVTCWDNSTRGLDASSALDYARSLRIMTDTCGKATLLTLYQASDAIYELVDKVLVIDEGRMLFQGSAREAKQYFEDLGYECGPMQTTSDFLTSITVPGRRKFRPGWEHRAPKGPAELEEVFRNSSSFKNIEQDIQAYELQRFGSKGSTTTTSQIDSDCGSLEEFKQNVQTEKSRFVPSKSSYTISLFQQVALCCKRQLWQLKGHMKPMYIKLASAVIYGLLIGSIFYNQPQTTDGMYSRGGMLFYSAILLAWLQLSELQEAMEGREILSRQKRFAFVRPSAVCLARVVSDAVVSFLITALYMIVVYFLAGLELNAGSFFIDFLFIYLCTVVMTGQFRLFASVSTDFAVALRYCGVSVLCCIVFSGYLLSVDKLISDVPWVGWIAYTTPALFTYEAVMIAEFHNSNFACAPESVVPSGPNYTNVAFQTCGYTANRIGTTAINGDDYLGAKYGFHSSHLWRNFGILCLFLVAYTLMTCWLSEVMEWKLGSTGPIQYKKPRKDRRKGGKNTRDEENDPVEVDVNPPAYPGDPNDQRVQSITGTKSSFTWDNLELKVQIGKESRTLLGGVSGYCKPGTMTALVGASGAGKSTLLTALTQTKSGNVTGTMFVDGEPVDHSFSRKTGYCQQMDIHDETSTIREAFEFSALLRQGRDVRREDKLSYVDTVLNMLGLVELQNALIGSLDIEKKKRVTIGVELCAKPKLLLFLDEPTSGLDSQGASTIVDLLRRLADQGLAILCTIHQANEEQFEQFDRVLALSPGGYTYYFGEVGESGRAIFDYFTRYDQKQVEFTNAADYLIEVVVSGLKNSEHRVDWAKIWAQSPEAEQVQKEISELRSKLPQKTIEDTGKQVLTPSPLHEQIFLLTQRTSRQFWRSPGYPYSRLYACFIHALINGLTYLQIGNSATDMQSKAFSCFLIIMLVPDFINGISLRFIMNRDLWNARERPSGIYGWVAFCTAQVLSEIPYAIIGSVIFYVLYYYLVGLPLGFPAGYSFLMVFLFIMFSTSWAQWIGALCPDSVVAANLMPFFICICELFNGILQPRTQMPALWKYTMYYITPFTYWIGGILSSILQGTPVQCQENELAVFQSPPNMTCTEYAGPWLSEKGRGYLSNPDDQGLCGYCQYSYGDDYLSTIELGSSKIWPYFGIFLAFTITNYVMIYLLVYLQSVMKPFWRRG